MSKWFEPKLEDCFWDNDGKEFNAYLYSDDSGAVYVSIPKDFIKKAHVLPKIKRAPNFNQPTNADGAGTPMGRKIVSKSLE